MLMSTQDQDANVALDACEFWLTLAEQPICKEVLMPHLNRLIPILMQKMKYSDVDVLVMKETEDDHMVPDRDEDINPKLYNSKSSRIKMESKNDDSADNHHQHIDDDDESDDDDDYEIHKNNSDWNLRKCSAAALDLLANVFHDDLLPYVLQILRETLFHQDWVTKESAVLALGAVAEGILD